MTKRLLTFACAAALLSAACNTIPAGTVNPGSGTRFVTQVADFADNVGLGNEVTVDGAGVPWLSYWGFPAKLKKGEIPVTRPIGAPYIPAVLVTSVSTSGIWIRGAAAQVQCAAAPCPAVPYSPATVRRLKNGNADNTNGTDMVIAPDGSMHVVWTSLDGVYYASGSPSTSFTAKKLYGPDADLTLAGPIGRPSVAVDAGGTPWVAYTVKGATQQVRVASPDPTGKWVTTVVATLPQCDGCPPPGVTRIGMTPGGPVIAYVNPKAKAVTVARLTAGTWTTQRVSSGVTGGLSMAIGKDGAVYLTYYIGDAVQLASTKSGSWSTGKVADVASSPAQAGAGAQPGVGNFADTTGVAVDDNGKIYVTWYDGQKDAVQIVSGDGTTFTPIQANNTDGGRYPSIAVAHDGSLVYVAWYANATQDQLLGVWGNQPAYAIGYVSPPPSPGAVQTANCGADKKIALDQSALALAFKTPCLVAPAGKDFSINFDDQDPAATGQHNIAIASDAAFATVLFDGELVNGPAKVVYNVTQKSGSLKAGTYYFHCKVHPTTMVGTLAVVAGAK